MLNRWILVLTVFAAFLGGCARSGSEHAPLHRIVILAKGSQPEVVRNDVMAWLDAAIDLPGSSITLCTPGETRDGWRCAEPITVPQRWSPGVLRAKRAFRARVGEEIASYGQRSQRKWERRSGLPVANVTVRVVGETSWVSHTQRETATAAHFVLLIDTSPSTGEISAASYLQGAVVAEYNRWSALGGTAPGSTFELRSVGKNLATSESLFSIQIPRVAAAERTLVALGGQRELLHTQLRRVNNGSALVESLYLAAADLQQLPGQRYLSVCSDLRQVTRGAWNFERAIPTSEAFRRDLRRLQMEPSLTGIDVQLCGLRFRSATVEVFSAASDRALRTTWTETLQGLGARNVRIRTHCVSRGDGEQR